MEGALYKPKKINWASTNYQAFCLFEMLAITLLGGYLPGIKVKKKIKIEKRKFGGVLCRQIGPQLKPG
jgi:hypothetical protein